MEEVIVGGVPVESLTGELAGVWSGWRASGDREVVREASAKGLHINLAYKFLTHRRGCSLDEAKSYFSSEVDIWINELLNKRQVHKASHILKNVGKNPSEFICTVCLKCREPTLRNYLAHHLIIINGFEEEQFEALELINWIEEHEKNHKLEGELISHKSLENVINLSPDIKKCIYVELYFESFNSKIERKLSNDAVWNYLLMNNKIKLINNWISINFECDTKENDDKDELQQNFENLKITEKMISSIENSQAITPVIQMTLNHLCRFGVFTNKEKNDFKLILNRLFSSSKTPSEFHEILSKESCNINKSEFFDKMEAVKYLRNFNQDPTELSGEKLFLTLREMCQETNETYEILEQGILETISFISQDPLEFLKSNYTIAFMLILLQHMKKNRTNVVDNLTEGELLKDIFSKHDELQIGHITVPREILSNILDRFSYLKADVEENLPQVNVTMYQLLDGYENFHSKRVFKWRQKNEEMPNFSNEYLTHKYGHKEKLTYMNYLKESRPNMAYNVLCCLGKKSSGNISSKMKSQVSLSAHIFALRHLNELDIISSCISFIELLGVDSDNLRLHVTVAAFVENKLNFSIGNLLESVVYKDQEDLITVLSYLERGFNLSLITNLIKEPREFVSALKTWDIIVRFARAHNATIPTLFLEFLASNDMWFEYLLVGQIFSYPSEQILEKIVLFKNPNLREHLILSLNNPYLLSSNPIEEDSKVKTQDSRQSLYNKIGVKQNSPESTSPTSAVCHSGKAHSTFTESSFTDLGVDLFNNDLWQIVLKCHQSQDPPRALLKASRTLKSPILTVLASCYEPSSAATHCYFWLLVSVEDSEFFLNSKDPLEDQVWSANNVMELFNNLVYHNYISTLNKGLTIFMPDNPLRLFSEFLVECICLADFEKCKTILTSFITSCSTLKCNKMMNWKTDESYLDNIYWIETVVVKCLITALGKCFQSKCLQIKFLEILTSCDFFKNLTVNAPNFYSLLEIMRILIKTDVAFNFLSFDIVDNEQSFNNEIERCINELLEKENYTSALELSKVANLKPSKIILAQYRSEFKKQMGMIESNFWKKCSEDFKLHKVCYEKAAEFFVEHAEKIQSSKERFEILKLALEILKENSDDCQTCDKAEMAMWKSCILAGPENIEIENESVIFRKLKTELLSELNDLQITCVLNDPQEKAALESLINKLLDAGKLDRALRISAIFNYKHKDVQILMLCLSLAEGEILTHQLTIQQKMLISESGSTKQRLGILRNRGLTRLPSSSSLNLSGTHEASESTTTVNQEESDCLMILTRLLKSLQSGVAIGTRIVTCYKLSITLGKSYYSLLILNDPMRLLQEVVLSNCDRTLEIAKDIISAYQIESRQVAQFLAEEIVASITRVVEDGNNDSTVWSYPLDISLHSVIELSKDASILGLKLLDIASKLLGHSNGEKRNVITLKIAVELLIRSHDCFTTSCNMEGIASVLRKCQQLANALQNLKLWSLLVRLVTGVGRFTEMNYVFKILKEHDQFEFLLGKGLDKVPGLKMALLDFVKRYCPENKELLNIIALHFRLHYEIALTWENEAREVIDEFVGEAKKENLKSQNSFPIEVKLTRDKITEKRLQLAILNFTLATNYFLQDNKLNLANHASHQAELVALQLSLLYAVQENHQFACILNLNKDEVDKAICQFLNFPQALIVARAYNHHVDWANAVYNHCIHQGETKYLKEFVTSNRLTTSVINDCVRRYRLEKIITKSMTENMRMLVAHLNDAQFKYVISSQLGFKDIIETMLETPSIGSYLKDTVWKNRYDDSGFLS